MLRVYRSPSAIPLHELCLACSFYYLRALESLSFLN